MSNQELEDQKDMVYKASIEFIEIKGLDTFIDYLQEVEEENVIPSSIILDKETYVQVLRQAITDYRKRMFGK